LLLQIEVFLPPNQRVSGTLVAYDSYYNLAIVGAECLRAICPEDVLLADTPGQSTDRQLRKMCREQRALKHVVAIGCEPEQGLLCGSMGVVSEGPIICGCKDLMLSTCKIKKVHW
jgi:small nuclear ribonucleoprotein (snRNP)-like protein